MIWSVNFSISSFVIPVSFVIEPDSITRFSPCGRPGVSGMCQQSVLFYPHFVTEPVSTLCYSFNYAGMLGVSDMSQQSILSNCQAGD